MASCIPMKSGRQLQLQRNKTLLNGRITTENDDNLSGDDSIDDDVDYEFTYTINDRDGGDAFQYRFDLYPTGKSNKCVNGRTEISRNNRKATNGHYIDSYTKEPCSKGHVSFCDINDMIERAKTPSHFDEKSHSNESLSRIPLTRSKSDLEQKQQRPPICSIQDRPHTSTEKTRDPYSDWAKDSRAGSANKVHWKERLKLAIKREVNRPKKESQKQCDTMKRRQSLSYDPDLEKSTTYIHGGDKHFSRAKTCLTPIRTGLKQLQVNYTETNLEDNQSLIFLDLLKSSHQQARIRGVNIRNIERRLEAKRDNPFYSTSFYENKNIQDPHRRQEKKSARIMLQKQYERQEKIRRTTDELHIGYKRTFLTMKTPSQAEVEAIGTKCRYLRCSIPQHSVGS